MRVRDLTFLFSLSIASISLASANVEIDDLDPGFEPSACVKDASPLTLLSFLFENTPGRDPASASTALAEIAYQGRKSPHHRYWLTEVREPKRAFYQLHFEDQNRRKRSRILTNAQANQILAQATQIVWDAQYLSSRERTKRCTPYALLSTAGERSQICIEHRKAANQSYSLFNTVKRYFR